MGVIWCVACRPKSGSLSTLVVRRTSRHRAARHASSRASRRSRPSSLSRRARQRRCRRRRRHRRGAAGTPARTAFCGSLRRAFHRRWRVSRAARARAWASRASATERRSDDFVQARARSVRARTFEAALRVGQQSAPQPSCGTRVGAEPEFELEMEASLSSCGRRVHDRESSAALPSSQSTVCAAVLWQVSCRSSRADRSGPPRRAIG